MYSAWKKNEKIIQHGKKIKMLSAWKKKPEKKYSAW